MEEEVPVLFSTSDEPKMDLLFIKALWINYMFIIVYFPLPRYGAYTT